MSPAELRCPVCGALVSACTDRRQPSDAAVLARLAERGE